MRELVAALESLGCERVRTYIQSGNAVFQFPGSLTSRSVAAIAKAISRTCGVEPGVQLFKRSEFRSIVEANPFPEAEDDPSRLHVFFLAAKPTAPKLDALEKLKASSERFQLTSRAFYLHAPDGIGRSKLAAAVERLLGVAVTARNWRTVQQLCRMADESP
ncbi:hypothetical protein Pan44_23400 [Caulifigura coniformis]|uniref:DUF1697 domain-containing protein n=2 Tax=Caulifigura coniformis TaxID=2527983 RepID=A0A517SDX5_9PLAN|nr:hypothetical protein Pan44_23400 [Caulifigura coniformis]